MFRVYKTSELGCLNRTIGWLMGELYSPSRKSSPVREKVSKLTRPSKIAPRRVSRFEETR